MCPSFERWNQIWSMIRHSPTCMQLKNFLTSLSSDYQGNFKQNKWFLYDDIIVKELGDWSSVVRVCVEACIKPTVIFYQRVHPITVQTHKESR
jgi:hypothetical protein